MKEMITLVGPGGHVFDLIERNYKFIDSHCSTKTVNNDYLLIQSF